MSPSLRISPIPIRLLRFFPDPLPATVPPPTPEANAATPFTIPPRIYELLLSVQVPITIAVIYASIVTYLNRYNHQRSLKPWAISKTNAFYAFVLVHNIFLAVYSGWTCLGLVRALRTSLNGTYAENGVVGVVDGLCKINGPRGLGNAATYNTTTSTWGFTMSELRLGVNSSPDQADIGRIWNEGLAFYGWIFYISKFYEVVDTFIILAKGKKSSLLQTYHHAGAMMSMWAGIRYMAPPIWMFVMVNSFIHTIMVGGNYLDIHCLPVSTPTTPVWPSGSAFQSLSNKPSPLFRSPSSSWVLHSPSPISSFHIPSQPRYRTTFLLVTLVLQSRLMSRLRPPLLPPLLPPVLPHGSKRSHFGRLARRDSPRMSRTRTGAVLAWTHYMQQVT